MGLRPEFRAFVIELFAAFGPVKLRPMFGVAGIFAGDNIIGLVADERIYLKTNVKTRAAFEREGAKPFVYEKTREKIVTSYFELPERLHDEPAELAAWARRAREVALDSPTAERKRRARAGARQPARRRKGS